MPLKNCLISKGLATKASILNLLKNCLCVQQFFFVVFNLEQQEPSRPSLLHLEENNKESLDVFDEIQLCSDIAIPLLAINTSIANKSAGMFVLNFINFVVQSYIYLCNVA